MKVINLGESNSVLNHFMAQLRDKDIQKDMLRFRRNLERSGKYSPMKSAGSWTIP